MSAPSDSSIEFASAATAAPAAAAIGEAAAVPSAEANAAATVADGTTADSTNEITRKLGSTVDELVMLRQKYSDLKTENDALGKFRERFNEMKQEEYTKNIAPFVDEIAKHATGCGPEFNDALRQMYSHPDPQQYAALTSFIGAASASHKRGINELEKERAEKRIAQAAAESAALKRASALTEPFESERKRLRGDTTAPATAVTASAKNDPNSMDAYSILFSPPSVKAASKQNAEAIANQDSQFKSMMSIFGSPASK